MDVDLYLEKLKQTNKDFDEINDMARDLVTFDLANSTGFPPSKEQVVEEYKKRSEYYLDRAEKDRIRHKALVDAFDARVRLYAERNTNTVWDVMTLTEDNVFRVDADNPKWAKRDEQERDHKNALKEHQERLYGKKED